MGEALITRRGGGGGVKLAQGTYTKGLYASDLNKFYVEGLDFEPTGIVAYLSGSSSTNIAAFEKSKNVTQIINGDGTVSSTLTMQYSDGKLTVTSDSGYYFQKGTPYYWTVWREE